MKGLFDRIPSTLFSVLASPNREIYVDCLLIIYDTIDSVEDSFQGDRDVVISKLLDYFEDHLENNLDDEPEANTARKKAVAVINQLKLHGWLGEEELGDYKTSLNFFDYSIKILEVIRQIVSGQTTEYTGEIFTVYSLLNSFDENEGIGIIEQAWQKTDDLLRKLKTLKANIYRYYYDITHNKKKDDLEDLLDKLLIDYKQNFFDNAYYNLKTTDSLAKYKRNILNKLSNIYNNYELMERLAEDTMKLKRIEDYNDAYNYLEEKILYIRESFNALDQLISSIDRKNEQYINAATSKILFLTNEADDIDGIFNRLFKIILSGKKFDYSILFNLTGARNLDTESLYNVRRKRIDPVVEEIDSFDFELDDDIREQKIQDMLRLGIFSKVEIDRHVKTILNGETYIEAKDLLLETTEDFIRLILIFLYSKSVGVSYDVNLLNHEVKVKDYRFKNFMIVKKG